MIYPWLDDLTLKVLANLANSYSPNLIGKYFLAITQRASK